MTWECAPSQNSSEGPEHSDEGHVKTAFLLHGHDGKLLQGAKVNTVASSAGDNTTDNQSVHVRSSAANSRADLKEYHRGNIYLFHVEGVEKGYRARE